MTGLSKRLASQGITIEQFLFQFVVVLLGVYLAILFEGKAADRSREGEARAMLSNVLGEMELDEAEVEEVLTVQKIREDAFANLVALLTVASPAEEMAIDSLLRGPLINNPTVFPRRSAYSTLVASGNIGYLSDPDLTLELANLYEHEYVRLINAGAFQDDRTADFWPPVNDRFWDRARSRLVLRGAEANVAFLNRADGWRTLAGLYQQQLERALLELREVKGSVERYLSR